MAATFYFCGECGFKKTKSHFAVDKTRSSGVSSKCKSCKRTYNAQRSKQKAMSTRGQNKLDWAKVADIRRRYNKPRVTVASLARCFSVGDATINNILLNRSWHNPDYVRQDKTPNNWIQQEVKDKVFAMSFVYTPKEIAPLVKLSVHSVRNILKNYK